jgi:hypothetical protein
MQRKKVTEKLENQLNELEESRNKIEDFLINFLINYSSVASIMHSQISPDSKKDELKIFAYQYLSSIISCWETFFRDVFVFLISIDSNLKNEIIKALKVDESKIANVDHGGYLASCFNFQNFEDTAMAFQTVFNKDIFEFTANDEFVSFMPKQNKECLFSLIKVFPDYRIILEQGMEHRHKMIHDANFVKGVSFNIDFIQKTETVFLLFPQLLARLLSDKYNLPRFLICNGENNYNYLFLIDDLISKNWEVVENTPHNNG